MTFSELGHLNLYFKGPKIDVLAHLDVYNFFYLVTWMSGIIRCDYAKWFHAYRNLDFNLKSGKDTR